MALIQSLQTGKTSLSAQQLAMEMTGNNISNAQTDGFTRQRVNVVNQFSREVQFGLHVGLGSRVENFQRMVDDYLETTIRDARAINGRLGIQERTYDRIESLFNELNDTDLSSLMNNFYNAVDECVNNPELVPNRVVMLEQGQVMATAIQELRTGLANEARLVDNELVDTVTELNQVTSRIAELNVEIMQAERGELFNGSASDLRDERGRQLTALSQLIDIRVQEMPDGTMTVLNGSRALVMSSTSFDLTTETAAANNLSTSKVVFEVDGQEVDIDNGALSGLIASRDEIIGEMVVDLDTMTEAFIREFNCLHAQGMGLDRYTEATSVETVIDPTDALNATGLDYPPDNGSFEIKVVNEGTGEVTVFDIEVDLDGIGAETSLQDIVNEINAEVGGAFAEISASITPQNKLVIESANDNITFGFGEDTSGFLAGIGINTFFTGDSATNIGINQFMVDNPRMVAGAQGIEPGDNSNFQALFSGRDAQQADLGTQTVEEYYSRMVSVLAVGSSTVKGSRESSAIHLESLEADRQGISGVNMDEEAINLIRFQGVYNASANYLTTIRDLINTLLNI